MSKEELIALDIYTFLYRTYYGTDKEEVNFRIDYGSNGAVNKVLNYISNKYLDKGRDNK